MENTHIKCILESISKWFMIPWLVNTYQDNITAGGEYGALLLLVLPLRIAVTRATQFHRKNVPCLTSSQYPLIINNIGGVWMLEGLFEQSMMEEEREYLSSDDELKPPNDYQNQRSAQVNRHVWLTATFTVHIESMSLLLPVMLYWLSQAPL